MQTDNEKYNETVQPNTAFLNELKEKLPEFFTREGSFNLDKFRNQLKDKNINEFSEGYQLDFSDGWGAEHTKELLNQLGTHQLNVQNVVIFGYSFNVAELRELENGLKQLDSKVTLIKRY